MSNTDQILPKQRDHLKENALTFQLKRVGQQTINYLDLLKTRIMRWIIIVALPQLIGIGRVAKFYATILWRLPNQHNFFQVGGGAV